MEMKDPRVWRVVFCGAFLFLLTISGSMAQQVNWVQWKVEDGGNGHWYAAIPPQGAARWTEHRAAAESLAANSHLATIASLEESDFVIGLVNAVLGNNNWSIGGFQPPGSPEPDGDWQWVTGEPFSFTNWASGEPNDAGGDENYLTLGEDTLGGWNDADNTPFFNGYVAESPKLDGVVFNPQNGHYYQLVEANPGVNWYEARDAAATMEHKGIPGHLATVTSAEEDNFLVTNFSRIRPEYVWLGATDEASEGNWQWITGEPWNYTNWDSGEPNGGVYENCLDYSDASINWNDESCGRPLNFYLVEYEYPLVNDLVTFVPDTSTYEFTPQGSSTDLFQDDFNDGDNNGWTITSGDWVASTGRNEAITMRDQIGFLTAYTYAGDPAWEDYTFEVDITFGTGRTEFFVAVRAEPNASLGPFIGKQYYLSVDGDNDVLRLRYSGNGSGFVDVQEVPYTLLEQTTYHITVRMIGVNLQASINGDALINYSFSAPEPLYTNGLIAVGYLSGTEGQDGAYFDNVKVYSGNGACPEGYVGQFSFDATLTNISSEKDLSNLHVKVDELTNNNLLLTTTGLIGEGGQFQVPKINDYSDGFLSPDESVDVPFPVCLQNFNPFRFFVNVLGESGINLTHTPWQMNTGEGIVPFGFTAPSHGWEGEYDFASIPPANDAAWAPAPDPQIIGFGMPFGGDSTLCGVLACRAGADFTYFQTFVNVPSGANIKIFNIKLDGIDDGVEVKIFNSENLDGGVAGYVELGDGTIDLKPFIKSGEENRIVLTHTDDCCFDSHLVSAQLTMVVE